MSEPYNTLSTCKHCQGFDPDNDVLTDDMYSDLCTCECSVCKHVEASMEILNNDELICFKCSCNEIRL